MNTQLLAFTLNPIEMQSRGSGGATVEPAHDPQLAAQLEGLSVPNLKTWIHTIDRHYSEALSLLPYEQFSRLEFRSKNCRRCWARTALLCSPYDPLCAEA